IDSEFHALRNEQGPSFLLSERSGDQDGPGSAPYTRRLVLNLAPSRQDSVPLAMRCLPELIRHSLAAGVQSPCTTMVNLIRADCATPIPLNNLRLFRRFFEGLPARGNPRYEGIAPLALQNRFAGGILRINSDKGLGDLLDQRRVHVAVRRETAMTIART